MSLRRSARMKGIATTAEREVETSSDSTIAGASSLANTKRKRAAKATNGASSKANGHDEARHSTANTSMPPPVTPPRTKRQKVPASSKPPPLTPTPSAVSIIAAPSTSRSKYSTGDIDDATPPPDLQPRAVQLHGTNAPLKTPRGSRVLADRSGHATEAAKSAAPADLSLATDVLNTNNLLDKACAHLIKQDPKLKTVIEQHHCRIFSPEGLAEEIDPFRSLVSGIMSQQVSGAAAKSIKNKFIALFNEDQAAGEEHTFPTPEQVAKTDLSRLRLAGLSQRKAEYVQGLAEKFANGDLSAKMLVEASDEEILEKLTAVRGLGKWSVEMFACFALKRMDILSTGDLGVQRGMAAYVGRDVAKLKAKGGGKWKYMSEQDMLSISEKFAPYRSLFMWYMWRIEDVDLGALDEGSEET